MTGDAGRRPGGGVDPPPVRSPSARARRLLVAAALAAAALIVAILGLRHALGSAAFAARARRSLESAARDAGCELRVGTLRVAPHALDAEDVALRCGHDEIRAPRVTAAFSVLDVLLSRGVRAVRIDAESPEIRVSASGGLIRAARRADAGTPSERLRVESLRLRGATVVVSDLPSGARVSVARADVEARIAGRTRLRVAAADVSILREPRELRMPRLDFDAVIAPGAASVRGVRAAMADIGDLSGDLTCRLSDGIPASCAGTMSAEADVAGLVALLAAGDIPRARGLARVTATWSGAPWPAIDVTARELALDLVPGTPATQVRDLAARLLPDERGVEVVAFRARALGGRVEATGDLRRTGAHDVLSVRADLADADASLLPLPASAAALQARVAARVDARAHWALPLAEPARVSGGLDLTLRAHERAAQGRVGVSGSARASLGDARARVHALRLAVSHASLEAEGDASFDGTLDLKGHVRADLGGLADLVASDWLDRSGLRGSVTAELVAVGTLGSPRIRADLRAQALEVGGIRPAHASAEAFVAGDGSWRLSSLVAEGLDGRIEAELSASAGRLAGTWSARGVDVSALARAAGSEERVDGRVSGSGTIAGSPGRPAFAGRLGSPRLLVRGVTLADVALSGSAAADGVVVDEMTAVVAGGQAHARGRMPSRGGEALVEIDVESLDLARLAPASGATGTLSVRAALQGSPSSPRLREPAIVRLEGARLHGIGPVEVSGTIELGDGAALIVARGDPSSSVTGTASLRLGAPRAFTLDAALPPLALPLPDGLPPGDVVTGHARVRASGSLDDPGGVTWSATLESARACVGDLAVETAGVVELRGAGRSVAVGPARWLAGGADLEIEVDAHLQDPVLFEARAHADARATALRLPGLPLVVDGDVRADVRAAGRGGEVRVSGGLSLGAGMLRVDGVPQALEDVRADVDFADGRVVLRTASARLGGGTLSASGVREPGGSFRLDLDGRGLALIPRRGLQLRALADTRLTWSGDARASILTGDVDVLRAVLAQDLGLRVGLGERAAPRAAPPRSDALARVALDVAVKAPDGGVFVDNDLARVEMRGELRVRGTLAGPIPAGDVTSFPDGRATFQGVTYRLDAAELEFSAARPMDPDLRLEAATQVGAHAIRLTVTGRASAPRIDLESDPELPRERITALLLSRGLVGGTAATTEQAIDAAASGIGPASLAGLDLLRVEPTLLDGQGDRTTRVTLGQRIGPKVFVAHSTDLSGLEDPATEVRWLAGRWVVRVATESTGRNVAEGRWLRRFRRAAPGGAPDAGSPRCASVSVAGVAEDRRDAVLAALDLQPGDAADARSLTLAARRAREELARTHPFCRVQCAPEAHGGETGVDVACVAVPGVPVDLQVVVDRGSLPERRVSRLRAAAWTDLADFGRPVDAAEQVSASILEQLRDEGRWHADVGVRVQDEGAGGLRVEATVRPGPTVRVAGVTIVGVAADVELLETLASSGRRRVSRPVLTPGLLETDREALLGVLHDRGHLDARVSPPDVRLARDPARAVVALACDPGPVVTLQSWSVEGLPGEAPARVRELLSALVPGPASPSGLDAAAGLLREELDAQGYADASVTWILDRPARACRVVADPGRRLEIGSVRVEGAGRTRPSVVVRAAGLKEGGPLSHAELMRARRNVLRLGHIGSVSVRESPAGEGPARDVVVSVAERDDVELSVGGGWASEDGPRFSLAISDRNVGGRAQALGLSLLASHDERRAEVVSRWKSVGRSRADILATAGLRDERRPSFLSRERYLSAGVTWRLPSRTVLKARYGLEAYALDDLELSEEADEGRVAGLGLSVARDTRDDALIATRGAFTSADVELDARALGSSESFVRASGHHARLLPFLGRCSVLVAARAGLAIPVGSGDVPASERYFVGGATSVRGFREDSIGPTDPLTGKPAGGEAFLVLKGELRARIGRHVSAVAFVDAGNAWADLSGVDGTLRLGAGPGLLVATPVGPLHFSYGVNLDPDVGEPSGRFHFVFGLGL